MIIIMRKYPCIKRAILQNFFRSLFSLYSFQILENAEQKESSHFLCSTSAQQSLDTLCEK